MVRRAKPLSATNGADAISLIDISGHATDTVPRDQGTPRDPRLAWLAKAADDDATALKKRGIGQFSIRPCKENEFRFIGERDPNTSRTMRLQVVAKKRASFLSIFIKKWPGIITAFDCLLKAASSEVLAKRMKHFFKAAESQRVAAGATTKSRWVGGIGHLETRLRKKAE